MATEIKQCFSLDQTLSLKTNCREAAMAKILSGKTGFGFLTNSISNSAKQKKGKDDIDLNEMMKFNQKRLLYKNLANNI